MKNKKVRKPLGEPRGELTGSVEYLQLFDAVPPEDIPLAFQVCSSYYGARYSEMLFKHDPPFPVPPSGVPNTPLEKLTEDFRRAITELDTGYLTRIAKMVRILKSRVGKLDEIRTEPFFTTQFARRLLMGDPNNIDVRKVTDQTLNSLPDTERKKLRAAINERRLKPDRVRERLGVKKAATRGRPKKSGQI